LAQVLLTRGGRIGFQVENAMAATAAAWALGISEAAIRAGLESFTGNEHQAPGRFNVLEARGLTLIVDYGHNPSAVSALVEAVEQFPNPSRTIAFTAVGDRRDADILRQGELLGDSFDRVILYEDKGTRGHAPGEIIALLRRGIASGRRGPQVFEAPNESEAIATALAMASPGDLIVIQSDESSEETLALVHRQLASGALRVPDGHAPHPEASANDPPAYAISRCSW